MGFIPLETVNLSLKNNYRSNLNFLFVVNVYLILHNINPKWTVKNILVLQSRIEILVTVPGLGHGIPVCGFHTRPRIIRRIE